ncbi:MAG: hypothetical protein WC606_04245 [Candidatus Absconditabacterales bacterium]
MEKKRYDKIQESKGRGLLSVTPEDAFRIDKDKEFTDFSHISEYLDIIVQSKSDLIALLHFSDLKRIKTDLFFTLSGIDTQSLLAPKDNPQNGVHTAQKIKDQILHEQTIDGSGIEKGGGSLLRTHKQRKEAFPIKFDDFLFEQHGVYDERLRTRQVPQTEAEQKEFLSQLIDQGFFAIENSYKHRDRLLLQLISDMGFFLHGSHGSIYPKEYTKWIIMEGYTRGKMSDYCLGILLSLRLKNITSYSENIITYLEKLRPYPELIRKICSCIEIYFTKENT